MVAAAVILQSPVLVVDEYAMTEGTKASPERRKPQGQRSKLWQPHAVWAGIIVIPFTAWMIWLSQTELPDGTCSGIGWGCEVAGWDAVGIALLFVGVPLLFVLLCGHLIIGLAQWLRSRRQVTS